MRHALAAVSVILVSVLLAMQWMPDAQAKKTKDPAAALKKNASKAAKKALKPFLRKIRADAKGAAKDLRAIEKAIKKGRPIPGTSEPQREPTDGVLTGVAILQIHLLLSNAAAERRAEAEDGVDAARDSAFFKELLRSELTANDCLVGRGGTCDQVALAIRSECDIAIDTVNDAIPGVCDALNELGVDVTARMFPLHDLTPLQAINQTGAALFPTQFEFAVAADLTVNGTVHIGFPAPSGNSTAYSVECHYATGGLATTTDLGPFTTSTAADFTCSVPEPGLYRLVLVPDCDDGRCAPVDEQWMSVAGPAEKSPGGGGGGLLDIPESFCVYTIDGTTGEVTVLNLASMIYGEGGLERCNVYFNDASNGRRVLAVTVEWREPPDTIPTKQTIVQEPLSESDPYISVVHEDPLGDAGFFQVIGGAGSIEVTYDRDVAEFSAGKPNIRIQGTATVRDLGGTERVLTFDVGVSRDDISRP